jgi:ABC-2 type transport system permease protein
VAFVLAALPSASALAEWRRPLPSFQQMKLVIVDEAPAYWTPETGAEQIATILRRYGAESERELTDRRVNVRGAQLDVAERHAQEVFDREIGGFYDRVVAQDTVYAHLGWLSPAVAFDAVSAALAGTDFLHHRHFVDSAESYRRALVNRMNADLIPNPAVAGVEHTNDAALWSEIPAFEYRPLSAFAALRSATSPLLALMTWLAAAVVAAAAVSKRAHP